MDYACEESRGAPDYAASHMRKGVLAMARVRHCQVAALVACVLWGSLAPGQEYGGGTGGPNDPYLIYTAEQMNAIGLRWETWHSHFKLMADIDLGNYGNDGFNLIGAFLNPFSGVFDGNGHILSRFTCISSDREDVGLFIAVGSYGGDSGATIKNLGLVDPNVAGSAAFEAAALAAIVFRGTIANCYVRGGQVEGSSNAGGLVAYNAFGHITDCYASAAVRGDVCAGGLVGYNDRGTITTSYSTGPVRGSENVGGLVGAGAGRVFQSFWDTQASGQAGSAEGMGKTTAEMCMADTYLGWRGCRGEVIWTIDENNDYPRLWWENQSGQVVPSTQLVDLLEGSGTEDDPFLIGTPRELSIFAASRCDWDRSFRLTMDLDLSGYDGPELNSIGYHWNELNSCPFTGVFDGGGHSIANFSYACDSGASYSAWYADVGLFGHVAGPNAVIMDLELVDPNISGGTTGSMNVGALVGCLAQGTVSQCSVLNGVVSGSEAVGGLIGASYSGSVKDCRVVAAVRAARWHVGGIVGRNEGIVERCSADGNVAGGEYVGGLVGYHLGTIVDSSSAGAASGNRHIGGLVGFTSSAAVVRSFSDTTVTGDIAVGGLVGFNVGTVADSYATGPVSGHEDIGGLVGCDAGRNPDISTTVANCYSVGQVSGVVSTGGLLGSAHGDVLQCFWDIETSGQMIAPAGTGLTTAQMKQQASFTDWDFDTIWMICEGRDYPRLRWEAIECED